MKVLAAHRTAVGLCPVCGVRPGKAAWALAYKIYILTLCSLTSRGERGQVRAYRADVSLGSKHTKHRVHKKVTVHIQQIKDLSTASGHLLAAPF